jgi:hypothetical protein
MYNAFEQSGANSLERRDLLGMKARQNQPALVVRMNLGFCRRTRSYVWVIQRLKPYNAL